LEKHKNANELVRAPRPKKTKLVLLPMHSATIMLFFDANYKPLENQYINYFLYKLTAI